MYTDNVFQIYKWSSSYNLLCYYKANYNIIIVVNISFILGINLELKIFYIISSKQKQLEKLNSIN